MANDFLQEAKNDLQNAAHCGPGKTFKTYTIFAGVGALISIAESLKTLARLEEEQRRKSR
jgi:hypothetical protein